MKQLIPRQCTTSSCQFSNFSELYKNRSESLVKAFVEKVFDLSGEKWLSFNYYLKYELLKLLDKTKQTLFSKNIILRDVYLFKYEHF